MKIRTTISPPEFHSEDYGPTEEEAFQARALELNLRVRSFQASGREAAYSIEFCNGKPYQALRLFVAMF